MLRRLLQLYFGLSLYGLSTAMFVRADLGADPWNVFHLGVAKLLALDIGTVMIATGALVLLLWIPLRQRPGLGTISNVVVLGLAADAALSVIPTLSDILPRSGLLAGAIVLMRLPRRCISVPGLAPARVMADDRVHARTGWSVRSIRTVIELSVLLIGWLLGGTLGVGTVLYALTIGPLIQLCLPWFRFAPRPVPVAEVKPAA